MAPKIDIRNPALSFGPYQPAARPMNPPTSAPAIPSRIVTMNPPGSRPGMRSLAITPTTNPNKIHAMTPMLLPPDCGGDANREPSNGRVGYQIARAGENPPPGR